MTSFLHAILGEPPAEVSAVASGPTVQFQIRKYVLALMLEKAGTVMPNREVMQVLKNFLFEVQPDRLRIVATNLELWMLATTELVAVTTPGTAVLPHKKLVEIVREADDGDLNIRIADSTAYITAGRTSWSVKLQTGHDYPHLPQITETMFTAVGREQFLNALLAVRYAACKDSGSRSALMMIDIRAGKMTACDGSRFQQAQAEQVPFDFRLPIGAVDHLVRLLKLSALENINVGESLNHLMFQFGSDVFIIGKLVAAFPDLEQTWLRPALTNTQRLVVDKQALLTAARRVRINADTNTSAIALVLAAANGGSLTVSARDTVGNQASETVEAGWNGPDRTIVVNHAYLVEMLKGFPGQSCTFRLGEDTKTRKSPVLLRDDESGTTGVLQQMLVDWTT